VLRIADAEMLQHLAAQHALGVLDAVGSEIVTAGFGPWGEQVLGDTLAAVGGGLQPPVAGRTGG
jgi:hypothetical protein